LTKNIAQTQKHIIISVTVFTYRDHAEVHLDVIVHISNGDGNCVVESVEPGLKDIDFDIPASQVGLGDIDIGSEVTRDGTCQGLRACKVDRPSIKIRTRLLLETVMQPCLLFK
jgi:hypothetical protein